MRNWILPALFLAIGSSFLAPGVESSPSFEVSSGQEPSGDEPGSSAQEVDPEVLAKIEKYIGLAKTGRMPVRPQAAKRLVSMGEPALARLIEECGEEGAKIAELGQALVEVLGDFEDPGLRRMLWTSLEDLDFPWRGAAARSLAKTAQADELEKHWALLLDRLAPVRVAAIDALGKIESPRDDSRRQLAEHLKGEPNDRVRRAAALLLDDWGLPAYLSLLVEDLRRSDSYFRLSFGEEARFQAYRALKKRLGDLHGYRPEVHPAEGENAKAIEMIAAAVLERAEGKTVALPSLARAGGPIEGNRIGLELRSCRLGEFFLRWNEGDVLYVGTGLPFEIALPAGSVAKLEAALQECATQVGEQRYWGTAGCDIEQLRLRDGQGKIVNFLVSKGQAAVPDLRPAALDRAMALLVESIPAYAPGQEADGDWGDDRAQDLKAKVAEALRAIGGSY